MLVRGDHRLNEFKLRNTLGSEFRAAEESEVRDARHRAGLHRSDRLTRAVLADLGLQGMQGS